MCGAEPGHSQPPHMSAVSDLSQLQGDLSPSHSSALLSMDKGLRDPITSDVHSPVLAFKGVDCLVS